MPRALSPERARRRALRGSGRDAGLRAAHARSRRRRADAAPFELAMLPFEEIRKIAVVAATAPLRGCPLSLMHPMHPTYPAGRPRIGAPGRGRIPRQRQRQQRRGVALCAVTRVRQQPPWTAFAVQRRLWFHVRHRRSGRAAVLVQRGARATPRLYRHAVHGIDRRALQNSRRKKPPGVLRGLSAFHRSQRERAIRHHADAEGACRRFLRRARDSRSGNRASVSRQRHTGSRISPQAAALLRTFPRPTSTRSGYNYETTTVSLTSQDNFQSRVNHAIGGRDSLLGTASYQRSSTDAANVFGFVDAASTSTSTRRRRGRIGSISF